MSASLNGRTFHAGAGISALYKFSLPEDNPLGVTLDGAAVKVHVFNARDDAAPDVTLSVGSGVTALTLTQDEIDAGATVDNTLKFKLFISPTQVTTLLNGSTSKVTPSYTITVTPANADEQQGDDSTEQTGKFTLLPEALAGR